MKFTFWQKKVYVFVKIMFRDIQTHTFFFELEEVLYVISKSSNIVTLCLSVLIYNLYQPYGCISH